METAGQSKVNDDDANFEDKIKRITRRSNEEKLTFA